MILHSHLRSLCALLSVAALLGNSGFAAEKSVRLRRWSDNTGTFAVRAALRSHDGEGRDVTLELEDGRTVVVPWRRMSAADREYLQAVHDGPAQFADENADLPVEPPADDANDHRKIEMGGIRWIGDFDAARQAARGSAATDDDRPIMCFRVLGSPEGFL